MVKQFEIAETRGDVLVCFDSMLDGSGCNKVEPHENDTIFQF